MVRPKYHVGDILYRKCTRKKSEIKQIVLFEHQHASEPELCYVVEEPLNLKPSWDDVYLTVSHVDKCDDYCDYKVSGDPKYHAGDKIKCLSNGRVVQIDLVVADKHTHGHPWRYHVTPWLMHSNDDGYHWCGQIDDNKFIEKTDDPVSPRHKFNMGDVIVVDNKDYFLVESAHSGNYHLSSGVPTHKGSNIANNFLTWEAVDTNSDIRIANPTEVDDYLIHHHKSKFNVGQSVWDKADEKPYLITKKVIREVDYLQSNVYFELVPYGYGYEPKYVLTKVADRFLEPYNNEVGYLTLPFFVPPKDPVTAETKSVHIERKAREIWEYTYKKTLDDRPDMVTSDIDHAIKMSNKAAEAYKRENT